jgi:2-polyprenyl-3-methyl-5-hydroxy-6-metoxy-1,4-benzoquinol methylase
MEPRPGTELLAEFEVDRRVGNLSLLRPISMSDVAGKNYWNAIWEKLPPVQRYQGPVYEQHPILAKFLSKAGGGEAIEIGCGSGNYMIYIAKEFGYSISGLDYSNNMDYVRANLEFNGIYGADLFNTDFFEFKPFKKYDLVLSGGFVEHFDDYEGVVRKHAELAKPGGLVVIIVPNLTHIHWLLCSICAPETLRVHRFPLMRRKILQGTLEKSGLEVLHCEYHKTFRATYHLPSILDYGCRAIQKGLRAMRLEDIGNSFGSPYLISVSRKTQ